MTTTDSVFQRALSNMLTEIFDGPPGQEAYLLNPGDPGLLRQLDTIDASAASQRPMPGKTTIAAHVDHVHFGLSILNRWAAGEGNPWGAARTGTPVGSAPQLPTISGELYATVCATKPRNGERSSPPARIGTTWALPPLSPPPLTRPITSGPSGNPSGLKPGQ